MNDFVCIGNKCAKISNIRSMDYDNNKCNLYFNSILS